MIIDCHYHLDPLVQPLDNLLSKMEENGIEALFSDSTTRQKLLGDNFSKMVS